MGKKGDGGASVNLDSFLDIMTCLVGVLVLIIILTGLDASQIRVLIPTPMEYETDKRPIFIEARDDQLYRVPVGELQQLADQGLQQLSDEARGNMERLMQLMQEIELGTGGYRIDLSYFMVGQFAIMPLPDVPGYTLPDWSEEGPDDWYGRILEGMNKEEEMLTFIVRDDSYSVFKRARHLAWNQKADVAYQLLDPEEPLKFGLMGQQARPQ
jgi:hypothetical protein